MSSIIDKDSLIVVGIIVLTAFWIFMAKDQAAPMLNTVMGGLLGYLGASTRLALVNSSTTLPPNILAGSK